MLIDLLYAVLAGTSHTSLATVADAAAAAVSSATVPPGLSDPIHVCAAPAAAAAVSAGAVAVLTYVLSDTTHVRAVTAAAAAAAAIASAAASVVYPPYSHHRPAPPTPPHTVNMLWSGFTMFVRSYSGANHKRYTFHAF